MFAPVRTFLMTVSRLHCPWPVDDSAENEKCTFLRMMASIASQAKRVCSQKIRIGAKYPCVVLRLPMVLSAVRNGCFPNSETAPLIVAQEFCICGFTPCVWTDIEFRDYGRLRGPDDAYGKLAGLLKNGLRPLYTWLRSRARLYGLAPVN